MSRSDASLSWRTVERGDMGLAMGPQHPSTHGVLQLKIGLREETVQQVRCEIGFIHRGVEKLCETLPWDAVTPVLERNDYLAPTSNSLVWALAVEKLAKLEVPERAASLRSIMLELQRIASHLVWAGTFGLDLGGALGGGSTLFLYCFQLREDILNLVEKWTGSRFHTHLNQIGGVRYELYAGFEQDITKILENIDPALNELENFFFKNEVVRARCRGVAVLTADQIVSLGATGAVARGSGVSSDLRVLAPWDAYKDNPIKEVLRTEGDILARAEVRLDEIHEAAAWLRRELERLPEGALTCRPPVRSAKFKVAAGEAYAAIESPRGEMGAWVVSGGKFQAVRAKLRSPSFTNLQATELMGPGMYFADLVAAVGSLDPVFGDVDR